MKRTELKRRTPLKAKTQKRKRAPRDPLDDVFSEFVRRRALARVGGCERCLSQKHDTTREDGTTRPAYMDLQCSHYIGRSTKATRWDEDNCAGLCGACHMYLEHNPHEHQAWFLQHLGQEAYDMLQARRRQGAKPDRATLGIYYKCQLHVLKAGAYIEHGTHR